MTQNEHHVLAIILLFISWHLFLKRFFIMEKEMEFWNKFFGV